MGGRRMSRPYALRIAFAALLLAAVVAPSTAAETGPDYVSSANVTLAERLIIPWHISQRRKG